jgi:hypothetical protein
MPVINSITYNVIENTFTSNVSAVLSVQAEINSDVTNAGLKKLLLKNQQLFLLQTQFAKKPKNPV